MIAIDPQGEREYVLRADRNLPEAEQTVWLLRPLTQRDRIRILDTMGAADPDRGALISSYGTRTQVALRAGLAGTRQDAPLRDTKGRPVQFTRDAAGCVTDDFLSRLPVDALIELAKAIQEGAQVTEEQKGESEPSPEA